MTQSYIGTKQILAWPQEGGAKVLVCGVSCHQDEESCNGYCVGEVGSPRNAGPVPGYAVKYADGYTSWSPKEVFEAAYLPLGQIGHLPPHQQRVVGEKAQLDAKLRALDTFFLSTRWADVDSAEKLLLLTQADLMEDYSKVLGARIAAFTPVEALV